MPSILFLVVIKKLFIVSRSLELDVIALDLEISVVRSEY